jgi:uncharacterized protein YrzB (UPF0473 family)
VSEFNEEEEVEQIIIPDEEGNEEVFEVLYKFDVEQTGNLYMMVIPVDGDPEVDEVYAFRYEEEGDDISLFIIEDDKEWEIVEATFQTILEQEELQDDH